MQSTKPKFNLNLNQNIIELADVCVKCGLCLEHCPTYITEKTENESPRGRIEMLSALAKQELEFDSHLQKHIDQCLSCKACEKVCPAKVQYGKLITIGREYIQEKYHPAKSYSFRSINLIANNYQLQNYLNWGLYFYQILGLRKIFGKFIKFDQLLPNKILKPINLKSEYLPKSNPNNKTVGLFIGCMDKIANPNTLNASIFVLQKIGYRVKIYKKQSCCGAISLHAGYKTCATLSAKKNLAAFDKDTLHKLDHIVNLATGCTALLQDYQDYFINELDNKHLALFSSKIIDINKLICKTKFPKNLKINPLNLNVLLHNPCTQRNCLKDVISPKQLLAKIPGIKIHKMDNIGCCGAAGSFMLEQPKLSKKLFDTFIKTKPDNMLVDFIASSNIGCALQISKNINKNSEKIRVDHPIILLAKALGKDF